MADIEDAHDLHQKQRAEMKNEAYEDREDLFERIGPRIRDEIGNSSHDLNCYL